MAFATLVSMKANPNRAVRLWVVAGLMAYVALPWYAQEGAPWWNSLPQVFGAADNAGIAQTFVHGHKWLAIGLAGLIIAVMSIGQATPRRANAYLIGGGLLGCAGLALSAWLIGPQGWTVPSLQAQWGHWNVSQPPFGAGAWLAMVTLAGLAVLGINRAARADRPA